MGRTINISSNENGANHLTQKDLQFLTH